MNLTDITSEEYMDFCTPITASCVNCGIPLAVFFRGSEIKSFGCGHCGQVTKRNELR